jgi:hypothetical protein
MPLIYDSSLCPLKRRQHTDEKYFRYFHWISVTSTKQGMQRSYSRSWRTSKAYSAYFQRYFIFRAFLHLLSVMKYGKLTQGVTLLICSIGGALSNFGLKTEYPDWGFCWFSSVPPGKCGGSNLNKATTIPLHPFVLYYHPIFRRHRGWITDSVVK